MSLVQVKAGHASSLTALNITLDNPTGAGHGLVVLVSTSAQTTNPTVSAITLGGSADHFAQAAVSGNTGTAVFNSGWLDLDNAGGQTAIAITATGGAGVNPHITAWVFEFDDLVLSAGFDKFSANAAGGTNWTTNNTAALSQPNEVALGIVGIFAGAAPTITGPSAPWVNQTQQTSGTFGWVAGHNILSSASALAYAGTATASTDGGSLIITVRTSGPLPIAPTQQRGRKLRWRRKRREAQPMILASPVSTGDALVIADTVFAVTSIPDPIESAGSSATPSVISATTSIPDPTESAGSKATPGVVQAITDIQTPTVVTSGGATVTPSTVQATTTIPAPTVSAGSTATPSVVSASASVATPGAQSGSKAAPSTVQGTVAVPAPVVSAGSSASPGTVLGSTAVATPTGSAGSKATPGVLSAPTSIPTPVVSVSGGATITPATVQATTAIPTPSASASSRATPTVVGAVVAIGGPILSSGSRPTPATVAAVATIPEPTVVPQFPAATYGQIDAGGQGLGGSAGSGNAPDTRAASGLAPELEIIPDIAPDVNAGGREL